MVATGVGAAVFEGAGREVEPQPTSATRSKWRIVVTVAPADVSADEARGRMGAKHTCASQLPPS